MLRTPTKTSKTEETPKWGGGGVLGTEDVRNKRKVDDLKGKVALKFGAKNSVKAKIKEIAKHNVIKFEKEDDPTLIKLNSTRKIQ